MRKIKKVTIRKENNVWQVATTYANTYNPIAYFPTKEDAVEYAKRNGWKIVVEDEQSNNVFHEKDKTVNEFIGTIDDLRIEKPHLDEDFAWKVYEFINRYKAGMFGELTLQQALDKYWEG